MSSDTKSHGGGEGSLSGWDKGAFWYPTLDRQGALLAVFLLLIVLHFDELWGLASSSYLVFGWWPITMAYHVGLNVLHVAFMVLIYLNWPDPADEDIERPGIRTEDRAPAASGAAEGD